MRDRPRPGRVRRAVRRAASSLGEGSVPSSEQRGLLDLAVLSGVYAFLVSLFTPSLMLSDTTVTGGDMAAHIYTPWYLRHHLLPDGLLAGWSPGWYAGFPMLHFYFPLVATAQALMSFVMPYEVAFKLGTVLGTFFLPVAAYLMCRLLRLPWPIASSLVGEYSYALSLGLCLVFLGLGYRLAVDQHPSLTASIVLTLAVLSHLVTVMIVVAFTPFLVALAIRRVGARAALARFGVVYGLAFALTAFWSIPFVVRLPYTTNLNWVQREGWNFLVPRELWLYLLGAAAGCVLLVLKRDVRLLLLAGPAVLGVAAYFVVPNGHIYNERYTPFWFIGVVLSCASFVGIALRVAAALANAKRSAFLCAAAVVALLVGQIVWLRHDRPHTFVDEWVQGNYGGYESLPDFPTFERLVGALAELPRGRVLWESSPELERFGSTAALMSLPYFSGQPSMEGIHFESSPTTPFHFLMLSELSEEPFRPVAGLPYPDFDLEGGVARLQLYDVAYYVTYSPAARSAALSSSQLELLAEVERFAIFAVDGPGHVMVPSYEPVVLDGGEWLEGNLDWFTNPENLATPLVREGPPVWQRVGSLEDPLPRAPLPHGGESFEAEISHDEIVFETTAVGEPHWVKTSYFPNWRVEGADGPYLASPSLMMVVPTQERVRLHYARTWAEWSGLALTGVALLMVSIPARRRRIRRWGAMTSPANGPEARSSTSAGSRT
jgi:hypothetical protein